jgi:hypothetical protein
MSSGRYCGRRQCKVDARTRKDAHPLRLGHGEPARRERDASRGRQAEAGVVEVVEPVLLEQALDHLDVLGRDLADEDVLVRGEAERALVHLGDLAQAGLEVHPGRVLHAAVLDEERDVRAAVVARVPAVVVDVPVEHERAGGRELVAEQLLDLALERLQAQTVDGVLETRVLAAVNA